MEFEGFIWEGCPVRGRGQGEEGEAEERGEKREKGARRGQKK